MVAGLFLLQLSSWAQGLCEGQIRKVKVDQLYDENNYKDSPAVVPFESEVQRLYHAAATHSYVSVIRLKFNCLRNSMNFGAIILSNNLRVERNVVKTRVPVNFQQILIYSS